MEPIWQKWHLIKMIKISGFGILYPLTLALSLWPYAFAQAAEERDVFNVVAGLSWERENNIFRVPSNFDLSTIVNRTERWDELTTGYAGISIDKPYAMQRFKLDYTHTAYRHKNYDFLDFNANEYEAAWLWALSPSLTGNLSANRKQKLSDYSDLDGRADLNIRTSQMRRFDADWSPHGVWHLLAGVSRYQETNSQTFIFRQEPDFTQVTVEGGAKYVFPSGSYISLIGREGDGTYDKRELILANFTDTGYEQHEVEAQLDWRLSEQSRLKVKAAHVERNFDHISQLDYSEPVGSINYIWKPTEKLRLSTIVSRDVSSHQRDESSFAIKDMLRMSPSWEITSKLALEGSASIARRKFLGDPRPGQLSDGRKDIEKRASVALSWKPRDFVTVSGSLERAERSSNLQGLDYKDTTVGVSTELLF